MDVYLVPIGRERYELYCEVPNEPEESVEEASAGFVARMKQRFSALLAEAERERRHGRADEPAGAFARAKARTLRYVAERIAEQRLLWHLRRQDSACLFFPDELGLRRIPRELFPDHDPGHSLSVLLALHPSQGKLARELRALAVLCALHGAVLQVNFA